ncbi:hypothetical protein [Brevibacterium album]|uniref:hypothetical protein n=1 Tax=Brevibacterium album TaxID=417948 RepID=UPI000407F0A8|nr:hypothetical protein [Brevibacterium album]
MDLLRRLAGGEHTLLPDRACAVLGRMGGVGFAPEYAALHREGFLLVRSLVPDWPPAEARLREAGAEVPHE